MATLVIGPQVKPGYKSSVRYDHAELAGVRCGRCYGGSRPVPAPLLWNFP